MDKKYVTFYYPSAFFSNESTREVMPGENLDETTPKNAYAYRTFMRTETVVDGETLKGEPKNYSQTTYFGEVKTLEDIAREHGEKSILYGNVKGNGYQFAVLTRLGNYQTLDENSRVITAKGNITTGFARLR